MPWRLRVGKGQNSHKARPGGKPTELCVVHRSGTALHRFWDEKLRDVGAASSWRWPEVERAAAQGKLPPTFTLASAVKTAPADAVNDRAICAPGACEVAPGRPAILTVEGRVAVLPHFGIVLAAAAAGHARPAPLGNITILDLAGGCCRGVFSGRVRGARPVRPSELAHLWGPACPGGGDCRIPSRPAWAQCRSARMIANDAGRGAAEHEWLLLAFLWKSQSGSRWRAPWPPLTTVPRECPRLALGPLPGPLASQNSGPWRHARTELALASHRQRQRLRKRIGAPLLNPSSWRQELLPWPVPSGAQGTVGGGAAARPPRAARAPRV